MCHAFAYATNVRFWLGTSPPLTEVSRALRARNPKKVSKIPGPQKVSKKSRGQSGKSPESLRKVSGECFWTVPGTFWRLFGVPGPEAPGDIFETFLGFRARRARETSVRGGLVPKILVGTLIVMRNPECTEHFLSAI